MSSLRHGDLTSYIPNTAAQHNAALNSYPPHPNMIAAVNGSTATHLPYYPTNPVGKFLEIFDSYLFFVLLGCCCVQSLWYSKSTIS